MAESFLSFIVVATMDTLSLVYEALSYVEDPELGVNIVDLGLVYDVAINTEAKTIDLTMTLTSQACPLQELLTEEIEAALAGLSEAGVRITWTFTPLWSMAAITDEGREQLRALGAHIPTY